MMVVLVYYFSPVHFSFGLVGAQNYNVIIHINTYHLIQFEPVTTFRTMPFYRLFACRSKGLHFAKVIRVVRTQFTRACKVHFLKKIYSLALCLYIKNVP